MISDNEKFLRKVNLFLANDLAILLPGIYPKEMKTYAYTKSYICTYCTYEYVQ